MQIFMQQQEQLQAIQSQAEGASEPCDVADQRSRTQMTPMNQELANNEREPNNNNPESLSASLQSESKNFVTSVHVSIFFSFTWYAVTKKNYGKEIHLLKHEINVSEYSRLCACAWTIMYLI